jgi:hypothetical protein
MFPHRRCAGYDIESAEGDITVRDATRFIGPDEYTYELFMIGADGKEFKSLENRVSRKN